jgi:tetratricopeptide (TPR) repeat protein
MMERYGADAPVQLLEAYCTTRETDVALKAAFGVGLADFEQGYGEYVARTVAGIEATRAPRRPTLESARGAHEADPADLDAAGRYALALLRAEEYQTARDLAEKVNAERPTQQEAAYVLARVALSQKYAEQATELLAAAVDDSSPHADSLALLARLRLDAKQTEEAARLYRIGTEKFPGENRYWNGLAVSLWDSGTAEQLQPVLETIAARDEDNTAVRRRLAQFAQQAGRLEEAVRWGEDALCIDIEDVEVHRLLAACYATQGRKEAAMEAWQAVLELKPDDAEALRRVRETGE